MAPEFHELDQPQGRDGREAVLRCILDVVWFSRKTVVHTSLEHPRLRQRKGRIHAIMSEGPPARGSHGSVGSRFLQQSPVWDASDMNLPLCLTGSSVK